MEEAGIGIASGHSKSVDSYAGQKFDLVVTVCASANETCPHFPGAQARQHWPFDDPAEATGTDKEILAQFRRVRDEIRQTIATYLKDQNCISS